MECHALLRDLTDTQVLIGEAGGRSGHLLGGFARARALRLTYPTQRRTLLPTSVAAT